MLEYGWNKLYPDIFCFSTTRHGGCSEGEYASLNCNEYCGDTMEHVLHNREIVLSLLPGKTARLVMPHQTHGCEVRVIDAPFLAADTDTQKRELEGVDALVTSLKGVCLGISTADCIPVLCYDTKRQVVAAVHAGWRGRVEKLFPVPCRPCIRRLVRRCRMWWLASDRESRWRRSRWAMRYGSSLRRPDSTWTGLHAVRTSGTLIYGRPTAGCC